MDIEPLKCYVSLSAKYHWYWFDDNTFQSYSINVSECIEKTFKGKEILEENIGKFSYTIDTNRMIQTNTRTSIKRRIKRIPVDFSESSYITLFVSTYRINIDVFCNKILDILKESIVETWLALPNTAMAFKLILLETARKNFVHAALNKERKSHRPAAISLQGEKNQMERAKEDLLRYMTEFLPPYWESEVNKCELKNVCLESLEVVPIQDILYQQGFECKIFIFKTCGYGTPLEYN